MKDIFLKLMFIQYSENLHNLHNNLPFLPEIMKFKNLEKRLRNVVAKLHDKSEYAIHTRNLKQTLSSGLVLRGLHRITKFKQKKLG